MPDFIPKMLGRDPTGSELAAGGLTASISHIIPTFVLEQGTLDVCKVG